MTTPSPSRRAFVATMVNASDGVSGSAGSFINTRIPSRDTPENSFDSLDLEDQAPLVPAVHHNQNPHVANPPIIPLPSPNIAAYGSTPTPAMRAPPVVADRGTAAQRWAARKAMIRKAIEYVITSSS